MRIVLPFLLIIICYGIIIWAIISNYKQKKQLINEIITNIKNRGHWIVNTIDNSSVWIPPNKTTKENLTDNLDNKLKFMPAKPWYVRLWRKFFPLKFIEVPADGKIREFYLK